MYPKASRSEAGQRRAFRLQLCAGPTMLKHSANSATSPGRSIRLQPSWTLEAGRGCNGGTRSLASNPARSPVPDAIVLRITTASRGRNLLVRAEASLPSAASSILINQVEAMGRSLRFATHGNPQQTQRELEEVRRRVPSHSALITPPDRGIRSPLTRPRHKRIPTGCRSWPATGSSALLPEWPLQDPPLIRLFQGGNGELEMAVSPNGRTS